jgi:TM2 domain-containing membrane protein YozV
MENILWLIALVIGIFGVLRIVKGDIMMGVVLIVVALLVGPGGVSIFS